jgi:signal transduction histidine kinase
MSENDQHENAVKGDSGEAPAELSGDRALLEVLSSTERKFLHDLANPLAIALGMVESVVDDGLENQTLNEVQQRRLKKAQDAMERLRDLLRSRRSSVVETQEKAGLIKRAG